MPTNNINYYKF